MWDYEFMNIDEFTEENKVSETYNSFQEYDSAYLDQIYKDAGVLNESEIDQERMQRMLSSSWTDQSSLDVDEWIHTL